MLKALEDRIAELTASAEQGIANHNFLLGSLNEAKHLLEVYLAAKAQSDPIAAAEESIVLAGLNS